jgi:hypothetical protein
MMRDWLVVSEMLVEVGGWYSMVFEGEAHDVVDGDVADERVSRSDSGDDDDGVGVHYYAWVIVRDYSPISEDLFQTIREDADRTLVMDWMLKESELVVVDDYDDGFRMVLKVERIDLVD